MRPVFLVSLVLIASCASAPPEGYSSKFDQASNKSEHHFCQGERCYSATCEGERLSSACKFEGDESLKLSLFANEKGMDKVTKDLVSLWDNFCNPLPSTPNPKVICHEGKKKIAKPQYIQVLRSSEEKVERVENGKSRTYYRQVFILN